MNINKYNILNPDLFPLILSKRFIKILEKIDDNVSNELLKLFKNESLFKESFIDITEKDDVLTFISSDKINKMLKDGEFDETKCWTDPRRIEIKLGRLIYRLVGDKVSGVEIEQFINEYRSLKKHKKIFKIVRGKNIKKWYFKDNYAEGGGNLKDSCMKHGFCKLFFDIYTHNPDKVGLLILLSDDKKTILGRALLWNLDIPSGIFMDRVYFSNDFILNMFINYAIKHKWYYKLESMEDVSRVVLNDRIIKLSMVVNIKKEELEYFPFVDNLGFYDPNSGTLTNDLNYLKSIGCDGYYDLCDHAGAYISVKF